MLLVSPILEAFIPSIFVTDRLTFITDDRRDGIAELLLRRITDKKSCINVIDTYQICLAGLAIDVMKMVWATEVKR